VKAGQVGVDAVYERSEKGVEGEGRREGGREGGREEGREGKEGKDRLLLSQKLRQAKSAWMLYTSEAREALKKVSGGGREGGREGGKVRS